MQYKAKQKAWVEANKKRVKDYSKKYEKVNKEKIKADKAKYYLENKEYILARVRNYNKTHQDKVRKRVKIYAEHNKEQNKKYRETNKDKLKEYNKKWREARKEESRLLKLKYYNEHKKEIDEKEKIQKQENKIRVHLLTQIWRNKNKDKIKTYSKKYRTTNLVSYVCVDCGKSFPIKKNNLKRKKTKRCYWCSNRAHRAKVERIGERNFLIQLRNIEEHVEWRRSILERDNFRCQICYSQKNNRLNVHHLYKSFSEIILKNQIKTLEQARNCKELWDVNNGITFCEKCHRETHSLKTQMGKKYRIRRLKCNIA